jgi:hypothetical protein
LKTGFTTTDAGAPEWGNFDFTIDIEKKEESSTLTLILFEESAKTVAEIMNYQYQVTCQYWRKYHTKTIIIASNLLIQLDTVAADVDTVIASPFQRRTKNAKDTDKLSLSR